MTNQVLTYVYTYIFLLSICVQKYINSLAIYLYIFVLVERMEMDSRPTYLISHLISYSSGSVIT